MKSSAIYLLMTLSVTINISSSYETVSKSDESACVKKCCQDGLSLSKEMNITSGLNTSYCIQEQTDFFEVPIFDGILKVNDSNSICSIGMLSCNDSQELHFVKANYSDLNETFFIQRNGSLYYSKDESLYSNEEYCIDQQGGLSAYLCITTDVVTVETIVHVTAKLISVPFLAATWLAYALLPEKNLHRKALMNHVLSLIPGQTLFAIGQYHYLDSNVLCCLMGFSILFFMVSAFFWMNVICIDIWIAFSRWRNLQENVNFTYLVASLYAWGLSAINTLVTYLLDNYGDKKALYHPGMGVDTCFLSLHGTMIYYFGPISIMTVINLILFSLTARNIQEVKKESRTVLASENANKLQSNDDIFKLYWKLLFVMGLNPMANTHVIQLISWSLGQKLQHSVAVYIWYFKDFSHACYGILVFLVFVCHRSVLTPLKARFCCKLNSDKRSSPTSVTLTSTNSYESDSSKEVIKKIDEC